jgi:hypothetical protein
MNDNNVRRRVRVENTTNQKALQMVEYVYADEDAYWDGY